jgi:DNA-binding CsgD family transcriptional regulator
MRDAARELTVSPRLRVSIQVEDVWRRAALREIVVAAGHEVVDNLESADVTLLDGDCGSSAHGPCVTLGGAERDQAGFLARDADARQIDAALRAVAAGLIVRSRGTAENGFAAMIESDLRTLLTPRELDVLSALSEGLTNKLIARRLDISLHTVKFHVESLFRKLGVRTRTEAVTTASALRRSGTIEL